MTGGLGGLVLQDDLVSVIVPTYRRGAMLGRAIQSVLRQDHSKFEIIVVDDNGRGSPHGVGIRSLIESFQDSRISLIVNEVNQGGALARNVGIAAARGSWIAFLDDDDEYLESKLSSSLREFQVRDDPRIALVYGFAVVVYGDGREEVSQDVYNGSCAPQLLKARGLAATTQWVCRRDALVSVGGFDDSPSKQDSIVMLKLFAAGWRIACVEAPLSKYHEHCGARISGSSKTVEGECRLQTLGRSLYGTFEAHEVEEIEYRFKTRIASLLLMDGRVFSAGGLLLSASRFPSSRLYQDCLRDVFIVWKRRLLQRIRNA